MCSTKQAKDKSFTHPAKLYAVTQSYAVVKEQTQKRSQRLLFMQGRGEIFLPKPGDPAPSMRAPGS